jgi:hypothetical protein
MHVSYNCELCNTMLCIALHTPTACVLKLCCTPGTMPPTKYLIVLAVQLSQKLHMQLEAWGQFHEHFTCVS